MQVSQAKAGNEVFSSDLQHQPINSEAQPARIKYLRLTLQLVGVKPT